ncbi:hypothetical protein NPX13_g5327 [Xylaria arbuscula]|uniref:Uncharacterized protein n=1 Tax=Xylaria arbuscula TaxID=114810 RepID=A0A9W8NEM9_9PEZI|nr:hypothetical protein NPX13_g5327 [Xylaria arbuscula]
MSRAQAPEEVATRPVAPEIYVNMYEVEKKDEEEVEAFWYGAQQDPISDQDEDEGTDYIEASDWLMEATVDLSQDLETSKKELDIIRLIIQEMDLQSRMDRHQTKLAQSSRFKIMKACREYSSSRCDLLRERLGQVQYWAQARMLGQQVPDKAPDEVRYFAH